MVAKAIGRAAAILLIVSPMAFAQEPSCKALSLSFSKQPEHGRFQVWQVYIQNNAGRPVSLRIDPYGLRWHLQELVGRRWKQVGTMGIAPGVPEVTASPAPGVNPTRVVGPHRRLRIQDLDSRDVSTGGLAKNSKRRFILTQDIELVGQSRSEKCRLVSKPQQFLPGS